MVTDSPHRDRLPAAAPRSALAEARTLLAGRAAVYPPGWGIDAYGGPVGTAWAAIQWGQFWPSAAQTIDRAAAAVPPEDRELVWRAVTFAVVGAECRDGDDWFGRFGWPSDDEPPGRLSEGALEEMAIGVAPEGTGHADYVAAYEHLTQLERSCPGYRQELLRLATGLHRYGNPRLWVTPGDNQQTLASAQAYFGLAAQPWMADDDGRLCVFHEGRPERVTADALRVRLNSAGVVRELRQNEPTVFHLLTGMKYPRFEEHRVLLPDSVARLLVACHDWPSLPRMRDILDHATDDLTTAWDIAYGTCWVTAAKLTALNVPGMPEDPSVLGRLLATLAERGTVERKDKRSAAGYQWRLTSAEAV
jgi:hypothetical protein